MEEEEEVSGNSKYNICLVVGEVRNIHKQYIPDLVEVSLHIKLYMIISFDLSNK